LAIASFEEGQIEKAEGAAWEGLRLDPDLAPAYALLGAVALESRQPEKALPNLQRAVALDASYTQAYFYLGLAYKSLNQPGQAITAFEQALVHASDEEERIQIRRHLGELYEMQEQGTAH
jgi:tetratricopeptide (TPR) repeat protein